MPIPKYVPGDMTFQEMYTMYMSPEFRQPCEMCIRRQASAQYLGPDKSTTKALAAGVIANNSMDIEAIMAAVSTDPDGSATIGNDEEMFRIVEKVWPVVADVRYPGVSTPPEIRYTTYNPPMPRPPQPGVIEYEPPENYQPPQKTFIGIKQEDEEDHGRSAKGQ